MRNTDLSVYLNVGGRETASVDGVNFLTLPIKDLISFTYRTGRDRASA